MMHANHLFIETPKANLVEGDEMVTERICTLTPSSRAVFGLEQGKRLVDGIKAVWVGSEGSGGIAGR